MPELRRLADVDVHCIGDPAKHDPGGVNCHEFPGQLCDANMALRALGANLSMVARFGGVDLLHSHTWYTNMAGHLGKIMYGVPHVITAHSLEVRRPWKAEQLDSGYRLTSWVEQTAYEHVDAVIAVSEWMRSDVLECNPFLDPARVHAIRNGIDPDAFFPTGDRSFLTAAGIDPLRPIVLFVGRITRQKGVGHLLAAAHHIDRSAQLVLCVAAADTPEIAAETSAAAAQLAKARGGVFWLTNVRTPELLRQLFSAATVFVCPSVYEPMGIVNLEAMACETAVVAARVGGIPEVVVDGETGVLVPFDAARPDNFRAGLATGVNELLADPARAAEMGRAGRKRVIAEFSWAAVAERTADVYRSVLT